MILINKSHLTAITRKKVSQPMAYLNEKNLINGIALDYGCGKGFDASHFEMDKYDPYYFPNLETKSIYDTITCNYVLNVIDSDQDIMECLKKIQNLLYKTGKAYITVRRDVKTEGLTQKGTYQSNIQLNLQSLKRTSQYEIYVLDKNDDLNCLKIVRGK